jgi:hypothetical protein
MTYFALVPVITDGKGIVTDVIRADQDFINSGAVGDPFTWFLTVYGAKGGDAYRANYAGVGGTYDAVNDVFYAAQPYPSWTISAPTWLWQAPVPYPSTGGPYVWDEATLSWVAV